MNLPERFGVWPATQIKRIHLDSEVFAFPAVLAAPAVLERVGLLEGIVMVLGDLSTDWSPATC